MNGCVFTCVVMGACIAPFWKEMAECCFSKRGGQASYCAGREHVHVSNFQLGFDASCCGISGSNVCIYVRIS